MDGKIANAHPVNLNRLNLAAVKEVIAKADKQVLVEIVTITQKHGLKGVKGGWKEFLDTHDKLGANLSNPVKRSVDVLVAFLETFVDAEDCKLLGKMIRFRNDCATIEQLIKKFPDQKSPQQRLVKMTLEHPQYTQNYSFLSSDEDWVIIRLGDASKAMKSKKAISIDCEMVLCQDGTEAVVRVCAVNQDFKVKLDEVINPNKAIADYRTDITGIAAKDLEGVTCSLVDVQKSLKELLTDGTILVGHSLHNDLKALKIYYPRVIDTSFIFKYKDLPPACTPSLNALCKSVLDYEVRSECEPHNCINDAQAAMKLVLAKLEHGFDEPISVSQKVVPNSDRLKLLLHKIPVETPCQALRSIFPKEYIFDIQADRRVRGEFYSTYAVFKDAREAAAAFRGIERREKKDSFGRVQKLVTLKLSTGKIVCFFIRQTVADDDHNAIETPKKRLNSKDGIDDSKRQRMCLDQCDHFKEIERLKQELRGREDEIFNLQKILAARTEETRIVG